MTRSVTVSAPRLALVTAAGVVAAVALIFAAAHTARARLDDRERAPALTPRRSPSARR